MFTVRNDRQKGMADNSKQIQSKGLVCLKKKKKKKHCRRPN